MLFFGKKGEDNFIGQLTLFMEVRAVTRAQMELGMEHVNLSALDLAWAPSARMPTFAAGPLGGVAPRDDVPVVRGQVLSGGARGVPAQPSDTHEDSYRDAGGVVHHVIVTRRPDG